jgi:predicted nucleotidyltransferase
MEKIILFKTIVGSRLWKMEKPDSDYDYFVGYMIPTKDYLTGKRAINKQEINEKEDVSSHEIGTIIDGLLAGNINFFVGVLGIEVEAKEQFHELQILIKKNRAKNIYNSIHGIATNNYKKYIQGKENPDEKRVKNILKMLELGINYFDTGNFVFEKQRYFDIWSAKDLAKLIDTKVKELEERYKFSFYPESLPKKELNEWLLKTRLAYLEK